MLFTRSKLFAACSIAIAITLSACSKPTTEQKESPLTATAPATGQASTLSEQNAKQRLIQTLTENFKKANINAKILDVKATEVPNLYWVNLDGMASVYSTSDGKYIMQGEVIRLGDKQIHNVSESLQSTQNKALLSKLKVEDLIVYPAKGQTKHVLYVFTDVSCPYCQKLHAHMNEINAQGIEVRYIAWPRGPQMQPAMESIWCSKDRKQAFDVAIQGGKIPAAQCKNPVAEQHQLGVTMGVNGTPAIYNAEGKYLGGYLSPAEIMQRLQH